MMHQQARTSFTTSQGVLNGGGGGGGGGGSIAGGASNNMANANGINDTLARTLNLQRVSYGDETSFRSKQYQQFGTKLIPPQPMSQSTPQPQQSETLPKSSQQPQQPSFVRKKNRPTRKDRQERERSDSPKPVPASTSTPATVAKDDDVVIFESSGPNPTSSKTSSSIGLNSVQSSTQGSKLASMATSVSNINEVRKQLDNSPSGPKLAKHAPSKSINAIRQSASNGPSSTPVTTTNTGSLKTPGNLTPSQSTNKSRPTHMPSKPPASQAPNKPVPTVTQSPIATPKATSSSMSASKQSEKPVENTTPSKSATMSTQPATPKTSASKGWLQPDVGTFSWETYLEMSPAEVAPKEAFCQSNPPPVNKFQVKMKLEAKDPRNTSSWCLATVINIHGLRLQLRLDGCDTTNDFFELIDSENIRPVGSKPGEPLLPPLAYRANSERYNWFVEKKLSEADTIIAQQDIFPPKPTKPKSNMFKVGMKLEAVDRKSRHWICPATIGSVEGPMVKVSFDGWNGSYDYTCEYYSRDLFPINWCKETLHLIQLPQGWQNNLNKTTTEATSTSGSKSTPKTPRSSDEKPSPTSSTPGKKSFKGKPKKSTPSVKTDSPSPDIASPVDDDQTDYKHLTDDERFTCQRTRPIGEQWRIKEKEKRQMPRETGSDAEGSNTSFSRPSSTKRARLDKPIASATVDDILQLLKNDETLAKYSKVFTDHEIDGKAFILLTSEIMIQHMGLKIGPVLKINDIIEQVKKENRF